METLQTDLSQRNDQIRRLESKLDEYSAMLKETVKAKEKLETVLEKQQEGKLFAPIVFLCEPLTSNTVQVFTASIAFQF